MVGDVRVDGRSGLATLVKLSRLMRLSEMSRKNRSTMFNHELRVGVKCMTNRRYLAPVMPQQPDACACRCCLRSDSVSGELLMPNLTAPSR